jgi:hypothetical protein
MKVRKNADFQHHNSAGSRKMKSENPAEVLCCLELVPAARLMKVGKNADFSC